MTPDHGLTDHIAPAMVRAARLALEKAALAALLASHAAQAEIEHRGRILLVPTRESKRMARRAEVWGRLTTEIAESMSALEEMELADVCPVEPVREIAHVSA